MSALKEAGNKYGYRTVWTIDGKIMYKDEGDTNTKFLLMDKVTSRRYFMEKEELFLILMTFYFCMSGEFLRSIPKQ